VAKRLGTCIALVVFVVSLTLVSGAQQQQPLPDPVATFSILAFDPATGEVGGAAQSRVFSVGNGVLWGEAEVGMVATQAIVDVSYGPQGLALLKKGWHPMRSSSRSGTQIPTQVSTAIRGPRLAVNSP
jgi:hypothetical protein